LHNHEINHAALSTNLVLNNRVTAQRMGDTFWSSVEAINFYSRRNIKSVIKALSKVKKPNDQRADNNQQREENTQTDEGQVSG